MANPDKLPSKVIDISERLNKDEQLQQKLTNAIDKLKNHPIWQEKVVEGYWEQRLTPEDRKTLYETGQPGLKNTLKKNIESIIKPFAKLLLGKKKYSTTELEFIGDQIAGGVRILVQLDLLPAEGITPEEIGEDIVKDEARMNRLMTALHVLITIFAPECSVEFKEIKKTVSDLIKAKKKIAKTQQKKMAA